MKQPGLKIIIMYNTDDDLDSVCWLFV